MRFFLLSAVVLLAGCATITGNRTFEGMYDQIQKEVTTRQQVVGLLGNPTEADHPDDRHTVLIYEKRKIYGLFAKKIDTLRLSVFINENDIVTDYKTDTMTDDYLVPGSGGGGAVYHSYQPAQPNYSNTFYSGQPHY